MGFLLPSSESGPCPRLSSEPGCWLLAGGRAPQALTRSPAHPAVADQCSGGSNLFTELQENSPHGTFVANLTVFGEPESSSLRLGLTGADAGWFYLEGKTVRLSVSPGASLDREALESPVLMVGLTCSEDGFSPVEYRIIVQVLNENDNKPRFLEDSVLTQNISELAAVHSVVFTTRAEDKDGDTLMYVIDSTSADGKYFRIDLPNSGKIVLAKALDFETKRHLEFMVHAVEMNTKERYNSSARIRINVLDGDDQYPRFLPCNFLGHDGVSVCVSPVYTANVTEREVTVGPLHFVPGSVYAEDGDRELKAAITYAILAGTDHGRFHIDNVTGAITMLRPAESRSHTPTFSLSVMAAQVNDANKYVVTEVRVRVLAANVHPPRFSRPRYQAFVREEPGLAALVLTYSGRVLTLQAADADFPDGFNPKVWYSLTPQSNHTQLFQITPSGLLVARADRLRALQQYFLQVIARDEESGETTNTTVNVEVLRPGQAAPVDPSEAGQSQGPLDVGILAGSLGALLLLTAAILLLLMHAMKKRQRHQQALERASLAIEKHPNVSLKWFQPVNAGKSGPHSGHIYFQNEGYSDLGDATPESAGGWVGRSEPAESSKANPLANSVGKADGLMGVRSGAGLASTEKGDSAAATLPNGQTLEPSGCKDTCQDDQAPPRKCSASAEPGAGEGTAESQPAGEKEEEPLPHDSQPGSQEKPTEAGAGSGETEVGTSKPLPDRPQAAADQGDAGWSEQEPLPISQPLPNCTASEGGSPAEGAQVTSQSAALPSASHADASHADASHADASLQPPAPSGQHEPPPKLPVLEEVSEETLEEDGPNPGAPTHQDPLAPLPISDVRMPVTLMQLLEDSIEC
ncbi:cadherin-related family member 5-like [Mauremys reevesii]|uniref:cadherin-related family member 5-like n=1 Tax=Mauremys reevesii TaxID=260615 RepID=UPI00193F76BB|nr:cadherin-related family member 5-like [Mauremys reevesii]